MNTRLGSFDVGSGTLMVSDPCYGLDTWCQGRLENVRNGKWNAAVERSDRHGWGMRCVSLSIWHSDEGPNHVAWETAPFEVGVDSGQAGFWDLPCFPDKDAKGECGDADSWYGLACEVTLNGPCAGVMPGGVVSSSGFGDGGYRCLFARSKAGDIVAARIVFLSDEREDDE